MLPYLLLFILQGCVSQFNSIFFYKKYQIKASSSLSAGAVYLFINGVISAAVSFLFLLVARTPFVFTPYSLLMATLIVLSSAVSLVSTFKAYQFGSIATFGVINTVGGILLNCLLGILFLKEELSVWGYVGIVLMIVAAILMIKKDGQKSSKHFWIFCLLSLAFNTATSLLSKQHQIEKVFQTADTVSFSIWIGLIRAVLLAVVLPIMIAKCGKKDFTAPFKAFPLATVSSVISGSVYVVSLVVAIHVPISLTSPLGTGLSLLLSASLPFLLFKERLSKRKTLGIAVSFLGVLIYLITA